MQLAPRAVFLGWRKEILSRLKRPDPTDRTAVANAKLFCNSAKYSSPLLSFLHDKQAGTAKTYDYYSIATLDLGVNRGVDKRFRPCVDSGDACARSDLLLIERVENLAPFIAVFQVAGTETIIFCLRRRRGAYKSDLDQPINS